MGNFAAQLGWGASRATFRVQEVAGRRFWRSTRVGAIFDQVGQMTTIQASAALVVTQRVADPHYASVCWNFDFASSNGISSCG